MPTRPIASDDEDLAAFLGGECVYGSVSRGACLWSQVMAIGLWSPDSAIGRKWRPD